MTDVRVDGNELEVALLGTKFPNSPGYRSSLSDHIETHYGITLSDDVVDLLKLHQKRIYHLERPSNGGDEKGRAIAYSSDGTNNRREVFELVRGANDVYMAKTINADKVRMVWDMHEDNEVVQVENYDEYEPLGWKKLKSLPHTKSGIREMADRLSDELLDDLGVSLDDDTSNDTSRTRTKPTDEVISIGQTGGTNGRAKVTAESLRESFESGEKIQSDNKYDRTEYDTVILAPTGSKRKVSNHYNLVGVAGAENVGIGTCNKGTYEYLEDVPGIHHIDDYVEEAASLTLPTSEGRMAISEMDERVVLHIVSDANYGRFIKYMDEMKERLPEYAEKAKRVYGVPGAMETGDYVYAPVNRKHLFRFRPGLMDTDSVVITGDADDPRLDNDVFNFRSDMSMYAIARLSDWDIESAPLRFIISNSRYVELENPDAYDTIETFGKLHDNGIEPHESEVADDVA